MKVNYLNKCSIYAFLCLAAMLTCGVARADAPKPSFLDGGNTLKVCMAGGFPPMGYYAKPGDTEMIGFEVDVLKELATLWGAKIEFVVGDFKALLPSLDTQRCGIVASGILITAERLKKYDGVPYFQTSVVMVTSTKDNTVKMPEDLSGKVVALEAGTVYESMVAKLNDSFKTSGRAPVAVQTYASISDVIQQVIVGRAAASITQDTEAAYRTKQLPGQLQVAYQYKNVELYGMYLRKNPKDLEILQSSLDEIQKNGKLRSLLARWALPVNAADVKHSAQ